MGGCFSKRSAAAALADVSSDLKKPPLSPTSCRRRDPPEPEEEMVKEVLSETPSKPKEEIAAVGKPAGGCEERSEASSEIGSLSEILSEAGERSPPNTRRKRSLSGEIAPVKRDRIGGVGCRSGGGISSPTPARKREASVGRIDGAAGMGGIGQRRDPGERSGRRTASPAAKRAANHHQRPWIGGGGVVQNRRLSAARVNGLASASPAEDAASVGGGSTEGKESLENPLVSLECFIFL